MATKPRFILKADVLRVNADGTVVLDDNDFTYGRVEAANNDELTTAVRNAVTFNGQGETVTFDFLTDKGKPYGATDLRLPNGVPSLMWVYEVRYASGAVEYGHVSAVPANVKYASARARKAVAA